MIAAVMLVCCSICCMLSMHECLPDKYPCLANLLMPSSDAFSLLALQWMAPQCPSTPFCADIPVLAPIMNLQVRSPAGRAWL